MPKNAPTPRLYLYERKRPDGTIYRRGRVRIGTNAPIYLPDDPGEVGTQQRKDFESDFLIRLARWKRTGVFDSQGSSDGTRSTATESTDRRTIAQLVNARIAAEEAAILEQQDHGGRGAEIMARELQSAIRPSLMHLHRLCGSQLVVEFNRREVGEFLKKLARGVTYVDRNNRSRQQKLSRRYINARILPQVKALFDWASDTSWIPDSIADSIARAEGLRKGKAFGAVDRDRVRPVDDEVVEATLPFLPQTVADMVRFQQLTGARTGEVCSMTWNQIDRKPEKSGNWRYVVKEHKNEWRGEERIIIIGPRAQAVLMKYLSSDETAAVFSPSSSERRRRGVGSRKLDNPQRAPREHYDSKTYSRAVRRGCARAFPNPEDKAKWWHPYRLRHAVATKCRRISEATAGSVLGHKPGSQITGEYGSRDYSLAESAMLQIG